MVNFRQILWFVSGRFQGGEKIVMKFLKTVCHNRLAHAAAQVKVIVQVVDGHQYARAYFSGHEQMPQVGP
jgi:hypothetical protein